SLLGSKYADVIHAYANSGTYTIRETLFNGSIAIDSARFSYQYLLCQTLAVKLYYDANGNCLKDSTEHCNYLPLTIEVDSNVIAIDTISATSGIDYNAY